jgi:adenine-specific DNA-methyltransferase
MSRLTDLIAQLAERNQPLADDLRRETNALGNRRPFGLNFERHIPETVQLPGRKIRRGDKVVFRANPSDSKNGGRRPWIVVGFEGRGNTRKAQLASTAEADPQEAKRLVTDLVVVAEFRDPIYPGLRSTGTVARATTKPFHLVINGENYHVLEALAFAYRGSVDCIYIDPPYNTRDQDWKYNNNYVDSDDAYRHSKWLAMMERRLEVAKDLLNPKDSVLIVTIDEREAHRLGLLLEQTFPDANMTMTSVVINPKGVPRDGFARVDEYLFFVAFGKAHILPQPDSMLGDKPPSRRVRWRGLTRTGSNGTRTKSPGAFYPIFIRVSDGSLHSAGEALTLSQNPDDVAAPPGTVPVWPTPRPNGEDGRWSVVTETFNALLSRGAVKTGKVDINNGVFPLYYLTSEQLDQIEAGEIEVVGTEADGSLRVLYAEDSTKRTAPKTVWHRPAHSASEHGSGLLQALIPGREFPYPKSLYAVEDALRLVVADKPDALILDFFAGSGTTTHAVARLNRQDGGRRRSICVTNNEVSADEALSLATNGLRPGDPEWESWGICNYITKPRIEAAFTGKTPSGEPISGNYTFTDEFAMSEGFQENAEFFDLVYEDPEQVRHGFGFEAVAPLLWLRAGCVGSRIDASTDTFALADRYAILFDIDAAGDFIAAIAESDRRHLAYIVSDDETQFQAVSAQLRAGVEAVRLYAAYLDNFRMVPRA